MELFLLLGSQFVIQEETKFAFTNLQPNTTYSVFVVALTSGEVSEAASLRQVSGDRRRCSKPFVICHIVRIVYCRED